MAAGWKRSFEIFLADVGPKPFPAASLERRNNNGHYTKKNCYWANAKVQANNRRSNNKIEFKGRTKTAQQWAEKLSVPKTTIARRASQGRPLDAKPYSIISR